MRRVLVVLALCLSVLPLAALPAAAAVPPPPPIIDPDPLIPRMPDISDVVSPNVQAANPCDPSQPWGKPVGTCVGNGAGVMVNADSSQTICPDPQLCLTVEPGIPQTGFVTYTPGAPTTHAAGTSHQYTGQIACVLSACAGPVHAPYFAFTVTPNGYISEVHLIGTRPAAVQGGRIAYGDTRDIGADPGRTAGSDIPVILRGSAQR